VLDSIDSRRTGKLDEVQATAALRNMGLAVTNQEASSFLRSVASFDGNGQVYSVEKLAQAISDMAAGQDMRHVKQDKMSTLLSAPLPASTESAIAIGADANVDVRGQLLVVLENYWQVGLFYRLALRSDAGFQTSSC